jgi:hypothetical protein
MKFTASQRGFPVERERERCCCLFVCCCCLFVCFCFLIVFVLLTLLIVVSVPQCERCLSKAKLSGTTLSCKRNRSKNVFVVVFVDCFLNCCFVVVFQYAQMRIAHEDGTLCKVGEVGKKFTNCLFLLFVLCCCFRFVSNITHSLQVRFKGEGS